MVLAAGRGERMRPLTDTCPKPLLSVGGRPLIVWALQALQRAGVREVVINHAHLGGMIVAALGDGASLGLSITYSAEAQALETAGGIAAARHALGEQPFVLVNADVFSDFDFAPLVAAARSLPPADLGLCVLVPNPEHHPDGDFALVDGRIHNHGSPRLTYSGLAVLRPALVDGVTPGERAALAPLLRDAADRQRLAGLRFDGLWHDVGSPGRLRALDATLAQRSPGTPDSQ
ncbi:MAG: nucleotidyltransferase family protein [Burkholderiaceae bacterium]